MRDRWSRFTRRIAGPPRSTTGREIAQDVAAHLGRGVQVLVAFEFRRRACRRASCCAPSSAMRRTTGVPAMPPTPSRAVPRPSITAATAMMAKSPCRRATSRNATPRPRHDRKAHRDDQLVGLARGGQHVELEIGGGEHARAALRAQHHLAFEHRERQRHFRARIGVRDRAADRALVAGLEVADERQRHRQQRQLFGKLRPGQQLVLRHRGADLDLVAEVADRSSSAMRAMSISTAGSASRRLSIAISDCPPASTRASSPYSASSATASSTRVGPHVVERTRLHRAPRSAPPSARGCGAASPAAARP